MGGMRIEPACAHPGPPGVVAHPGQRRRALPAAHADRVPRASPSACACVRARSLALAPRIVACPLGVSARAGLIPDADTPLDLSVWGPLAATGTGAITKGRAIILIAHVHALMVSVASALAPFPFSDKLTLNMKASEADEQAYGLFPPLEAGLTPAAEILNGRLAMLGLISVVISSVASGTPFLETVDAGLGGMLLK